MPVTFQGGYVGGPTAQPLDLSSIGQGITARNQRLDAPQAARLEQYDLPGLAYMASNGDENAKRFLDRYYGRDQWQQYIPTLEGNTFIPPAGVPWDVNARARLEIDTFGFAPSMGESAPAGKEAGQQKSSEQVNPEQQTNPEVVQTESTPPIIESQTQITTPPVTDNTVVTDTATETPRQQWQRPWKQQEIVESTPPAQQPSRQVLGYDRNKSVNAEAPVEWQPNANVMQAMEGVLDAMAQAVQRGATPEQAYEGMQRSHDPNLLKLRQAVAGVVGPDGKPLSEQAALDWYQRTYRQGMSGVTDPMNQLDLVARMNQQRQAMAAAQARRQQQQTQQSSAPPSEPGYNPNALMQMPLMGNPNTLMPQRPQSGPTQPVPIDPRTGRPISQTPQQPYSARVAQSTEGANYQSVMQLMEPATLTQTVSPVMQAMTEARDAARMRAADIATQTEQQLAQEQIQIIDEATGRGGETTPTLYLGKRAEGIPLHSAAERSTAQHIQKLVTSPADSRSGKAAAAAIRNTVKRSAPELRAVIQERQQNPATMVPQGQFARQVTDAIRADPQGMAMFFNDLTTNYLNAGQTQAQTEYQQALARESTARARSQEMANAATESLGTEFITATQREQLRSLELANKMAELQLGFAPQQMSAQIMESLTAIGVNRINAQAAADMLGFYWAQLAANMQLQEAANNGKLASVLSEDQTKRMELIIDAMRIFADPDNKVNLPNGGEEKFLKELTAGLTGYTWSDTNANLWARIFQGLGKFNWTFVPGFNSTQQGLQVPLPVNTTPTPPTQEETNVGSDYNLQ